MDEYDQDIEIPSCIFFDFFDSVSFDKIGNGCNSGQSRSTVNIGLNTVLNFKIELGTNASNAQGIKNIVSIEKQTTASNNGNEYCFLTFQHEVVVTEHLVGDAANNSANAMDSTIYGYWLPVHCNDTCGSDSKNTTQKKRELIQYGVRFDNTNEKFVPFVIENKQRVVKRFFDIAKDMVPYTNNETVLNMTNWDILSSHVNDKLLNKLLPRHVLFDSDFEKTGYSCYYVDSTMSTREEVENLQTMLNSNKSTQTDVNVENNDNSKIFSEGENINYTYIKFKSSQAIRPDFKMTDFLDRSYYLNKLASTTSSCSGCVSGQTTEKIGDGLVGEFQVSYIHMYCLGNYGSALQWHNIIELFQTASLLENIIDIPDFYKMLKLQIVLLPAEYVHSFINLKIWEKCFFKLLKKHRGQSDLERFIKQRLFNTSIQEGEEEEEEEDSGDRIVELDENNFTLIRNKKGLSTGDNLKSQIGEVHGSEDDDDDHGFVYINHTSSENEDEYDDPDDDNLPSGYTVVNQVVYRKV